MKRQKNLIYLATISLLAFIILLISISLNNSTPQLDKTINSLMPSFQNNTLVMISKIINIAFDTKILLILTLIISALLYLKKNKNEAIFLAAIMVIGGAAIYLIKEIVQRARPLNALLNETNFSFPSGHATIGVIFFGTLIYLILNKIKSRQIKITLISLSVLMILIIGISRLILNVHWLTDVLAGLFLGLTILTSGILFKQVLESR